MKGNGKINLTQGSISCSDNFSVTDQASLTMTDDKSTIRVGNDLIFKTSSTNTLRKGTISCGGNAKLDQGYIAAGRDHTLHMTYTDGWGIFCRKGVWLKENCGQKIGYLYFDDAGRYNVSVQASDVYLTNKDDLQASTIIGKEIPEIDQATLKSALTYNTTNVLKSWAVDPVGGGSKLSNEEKAAIVMAHLNYSSKHYSTCQMVSSGLADNSGDIDFYYLSGNKICHNTFRYNANFTYTNGSNCIGTAYITYKGNQYTINCSDTQAMNKQVTQLMASLRKDGQELAKSTVSFTLGVGGSLEPDALIVNCFDLFEYFGITPSGSSKTLEEVANECNGKNEDTRKAIVKLIKAIKQ